MQQHVDSLLQVVGRPHEAASGAGSSRGDKEAKVSKLSDEDDIEAYLTTFERMMMAYGVPKDRWVFRVAPQLTGKAQQAYAAMAAEDTGDYDQLKAAIFQRYSITETYRVRFRSVARAREESYGNGDSGNGPCAEVAAEVHRCRLGAGGIHGGAAAQLYGWPGRPESAGSSQGAL